MDGPNVKILLNGEVLWVRQGTLDSREGPIMPEPDHDINASFFEDSYAHIFPDGTILRYRVPIGHVDDIVVLGDEVTT